MNARAGNGAGAGTSAGVPPDSYRELAELDGAYSVRWAKQVSEPRALEAEPLDLEILALVASMRHVLSSQIHRRFNPGRAITTTQRRLKRLSDAGLVRRFQFHRRDGGGVPMCYAITVAGLELLHAHDRLSALGEGELDTPPGSTARAGSVQGERLLRQARHDVHVAGWTLALERAVDGAPLTLRGAQESVLSPPMRSGAQGRAALGPDELTPAGRACATRVPAHRLNRCAHGGGAVRDGPSRRHRAAERLRERIGEQAPATGTGVR